MKLTYTILLFLALLYGNRLSAQFASVTALEPLEIANNTADKPQSKVWHYADTWWTVLTDETGTYVWRLDGTRWTKMLLISPGSYAKADCKVVGNLVHVLLFRGDNASYLISVEYNAATNGYELWSERDTRITLDFELGTETATLDIDSKGRMWIASDSPTEIQVRWSEAPYASFSAPLTIATGIDDDDISGIIALPGKIGVLWSNRLSKRFGFKTHTDGADPAVWSADEVPAAKYALSAGEGFANDHLNMALASDGTLYCVIKTHYETALLPKIGLLVRRPDGSWDKVYNVSTIEGTRPILIMNEAMNKMKVIYTSMERGGDILYRESAIDNISFGLPHTLMPGNINFASSAKDNYSSEILVIASTPTHAVGIIGIDSETPVAPEQASRFIAFPNPFDKDLTLSFTLEKESKYSIDIYTGIGRKTAIFFEGWAEAGQQYVFDVNGDKLAGGVMFVRLKTSHHTQVLRLTLNR
ncbi:MAG: T9SS C-terminal target domain-containing protein [Bacteroidetes bacterium]|nr:T9SS C-terminal target domain-containing protein [Bacteroidota bacterium]